MMPGVWRTCLFAGVLAQLVAVLVLPLGLAASAAAAGGGVRVIGAGLGRTGTDSLRWALTRLGFKTYHMFENIDSGSEHMEKGWEGFGRGDENGADRVIDNVLLANGYNATTDFPVCLLYRELLARNPDAKVILSVRSSPEAWRKSVERTIGRFGAMARKPPLKYVLPRGFADLDDAIWASIGATRDPSGKLHGLEEGYTRWIQQVKDTVPKDQLLVHSSPEGWPPLCAFLGVADADCPTTPYPRTNTGASFGSQIDVMEWATETWPLPVVIAAAVAALLVWLCCCRRRGAADKVKVG